MLELAFEEYITDSHLARQGGDLNMAHALTAVENYIRESGGVILDRVIATNYDVGKDGTREPFLARLISFERDGKTLTLGERISKPYRGTLEDRVKLFVNTYGYRDLRDTSQQPRRG